MCLVEQNGTAETVYQALSKQHQDLFYFCQEHLSHVACQMFPSKPKFFQVAYEDATKDPYRYVFLDFHLNSQEFARVRGNILPCDSLDKPCCLYLPKDMQI